ncbi:hypothetical protein SCLCIDRAFT_145784, partial [Scleroderma citrinum Foug A]
PSGLLTSENLRGREIFEIFVVDDNIHRGGRALQVVLPGFEGLENSEELLVMCVIVQLRRSEGARIEGDQPNLAIRAGDGKDTVNRIVRSISFDGNQGARLIVSKDGSCCEGLLQPIEGALTVFGEVPRGIFPSKLIEYEAMVEIHEAEEGLDVLHFVGFRPITNSSDFVLRHCQTIRGEKVSEVFHQVRMELTLFRFSKELALAQVLKHFPNVLDVVLHIVRINQDVVEVYYHADIKHICKD